MMKSTVLLLASWTILNMVYRPVSCQPQWKRVGGECFWVSETQKNWTSAQQECEQLGGSLAEPQDPEILRNYINTNELHGDYWIGGRKKTSSDSWDWEWVSGEPLIDAFQEGRGNRGYQCLDFQSNISPPLNDFDCDNAQFFICEGSVNLAEIVEDSVCKAKKKCKRAKGVCQANSEVCCGTIIEKGCKGNGCTCCAPDSIMIPEPTPNPETEIDEIMSESSVTCSSVNLCTECVAHPSCDWCLVSHRCTSAQDNTCTPDDVVVYAHNPNGTNVGKRFRHGPFFCPMMNITYNRIGVFGTNSTKYITVGVKSIPTFMKNFTCELDWEYNGEHMHTESSGVYSFHTWSQRSEINCGNMGVPEIHKSEIIANFTIKYNGNAIENQENKYVLIYNCKYLANNCEECITYRSPYDCDWCIPMRTCSSDVRSVCNTGIRRHIINRWSSPDECPASPNISSLEWCESPFIAIGSECFFISNIVEEIGGDTPINMTWNDAQRFCQEIGGDLAQPYKLKDLKDYFQKSENLPTQTGSYWVGGTRRSGRANSFTWISKEDVRRDWVKTSRTSEDAEYDCLQFQYGRYQSDLIPQNCSGTYPWICEYISEPYFESPGSSTVAVETESDASLLCTVKHLGNQKVLWVRGHDSTLLTGGLSSYTNDPRIYSSFSNGDTWTLTINNVTSSDSGLYVCKVDSNPPLARYIELEVNSE